jgi:hypothetical protein
MPPAHLVLQTESADKIWQPGLPQGQAIQVIDPDMAERLRTLLNLSMNEQVLGHSSLALAGEDRPSHAWFMGLAPAQSPRYAVVVLLEHGGEDGLAQAEQIGQAALIAALNLAR